MIYLFDIDGTLLLSGGAGTRALNQVFREQYQVDDAMRGVEPAGKTDVLIVEEIFANRMDRSPANNELSAIFDTYIELLRDEVSVSERYRLMHRAREVVEELATGQDTRLGLATGNVRAAAQIKLERAGMWERFEFGGYGDDARVRSDIVAAAISRARDAAGAPIPDRELVVVGDTPHDVTAAHACGIRAVTVCTGSYDRDALAAAAADVVLDTLAELPAWHVDEQRQRVSG